MTMNCRFVDLFLFEIRTVKLEDYTGTPKRKAPERSRDGCATMPNAVVRKEGSDELGLALLPL